jgi:hypothetical protein
MFVGADLLLDVSFRMAEYRLANLAHDGWLSSASEGAYADGLADGLIRVGALDGAAGVSKLVRVHFRELVTRADNAVLTLRWEGTSDGGDLFPALDADIVLTPAGEQSVRLTVTGAYRQPRDGLGAEPDRAILQGVATATIRSLLNRVAAALAHPENGRG